MNITICYILYITMFAMRKKKYTVSIERRRDQRLRTNIVAKLITEEMKNPFHCIIENISKGGVKIEFPKSIGLPNRFILKEWVFGTEFECTIQWRKSDEVGLRFINVSNPDNLEKLIQRAQE